MNNQDYQVFLNSKMEIINDVRGIMIKQATTLLKDTFAISDTYYLAAINRSVALIDGISILLEKRNLLCVGALLRMQLDNCMRIYGTFIAEDNTELFNNMIDGSIPFYKFKDDEGKRMSDSRLCKRLAKYDERITAVYNKSSGYVHLSSVAFQSAFMAEEPYVINMNIGHPLAEKYNAPLSECIEAFIHYLELQCILIDKVIEWKNEFDNSHRNDKG